MESDATSQHGIVDSDHVNGRPSKQKPKSAPKRVWSLKGLEELGEFIITEEERTLLNQRLRLFDAAKDNGLYMETDSQKHSSEIRTAIDDIFINKKPIIGYNGGLWPLAMIQAKSKVMKALGAKSTEMFQKKEKFKKTAKDTKTSDFAIEMVLQMTKNWADAQDQRMKHALAMMRVESEVREKNLTSWITFLKSIADIEHEDDVLKE